MFDLRRITLFSLEKRLSKHKMTIFSKNLGGHEHFGLPLAAPMRRTQTSDQEYNDLTANTVLPQHLPKLFTRNPVVCFLEVNKICVDVFCIFPRFLENLLDSDKYETRKLISLLSKRLQFQ